MASRLAFAPIESFKGLGGGATLQRFAPSLNAQQARAVDKILSADSWTSTQRLLQPVRKAMAAKIDEHQHKAKKRKKGQSKAKKAVPTTSSSASSTRPSLAGQDTVAVVLPTNSRSATRAAAASHSHQHHKLPAQPSDGSGDDDALDEIPAAASASAGAPPPASSEVPELHLHDTGAGEVTAMDSEDSEKEAEDWHNLRTSSRRLAKAPTRDGSDLVVDTRYAAPEDFKLGEILP